MKNKKIWDVVVVGGGPAGMMAAGRAAERGRTVLLLEKNAVLGKKLLLTGGGRCNITNNKPTTSAMLAQYKESGKFLFSAFAQFGVAETLDFFKERGLELREEAEGRMFPVSNRAQSVLDVLMAYLKKGGVTIRTKAAVKALAVDCRVSQVITTLADQSVIIAKACILACGGTSRPETGSTGEGLLWLKKLGHTIVKSEAALVPIALKNSWVKKIAGITLSNIKLTTFKNGVKQKVYKGNILFTHFGISGPLVLNISAEVGKLLRINKDEGKPQKNFSARIPEVKIMLDLFPSDDHGTLRQKIQALLANYNNKQIKNTLATLLPNALVNVLLTQAKIRGETPNHSVRTIERQALIILLKSVPLQVAGLLGKDKAIATAGGVALHHINFKNMQSRVARQLYIVGDMLDTHHHSGGYSLQICWTTGFVAGDSC